MLPYRPGLLLGVGLGAFLDGILFHQVLRWHHLVSDEEPTDTVAGLDRNTLFDGLFHVGAWLVLVWGLQRFYVSARAGTVPWGAPFAGSLLVGVGGFNLFDAVVSHWVLGLHHIHEGSYETLSDVVYLVVAVAILAGGLAVSRRDGPRVAT